MTGIADCCARAASGHVAATPPIKQINSRRLMDVSGTNALALRSISPGKSLLCSLRVKADISHRTRHVYLQKQTSTVQQPMSATGQKRTLTIIRTHLQN